MYPNYEILPFYDSLIAKVIVRGASRAEAINRMYGALGEFIVEGPKTTVPLGQALMNDSLFRRGQYNTAYLDTFIKNGAGLTNLLR